jgi:Sulfotransferase family
VVCPQRLDRGSDGYVKHSIDVLVGEGSDLRVPGERVSDMTRSDLQAAPTPLGAIFGAGRSGTSWLGSLVASHPDVTFRFEPFHRLRSSPSIEELLTLIRAGGLDASALDHIRTELGRAHPDTDKPPFFKKTNDTLVSRGRQRLWPLAKRSSSLHPLYARLHRPLGDSTLIVKEVGLVNVMASLLTASVPVVYLVRHPCAVVSSLLRGQTDNLMPAGRRSTIRSILEDQGGLLQERFGSDVEDLEPAQQEAILWRVDVERALSACTTSDTAHVLIYEALVEDPLGSVEAVLAHFGLAVTREVQKFIEDSTKPASSFSDARRGVLGVNSYFRVYRDSVSAREGWKATMPDDIKRQVLDVVQDSSVWKTVTDAGLWDPS